MPTTKLEKCAYCQFNLHNLFKYLLIKILMRINRLKEEEIK